MLKPEYNNDNNNINIIFVFRVWDGTINSFLVHFIRIRTTNMAIDRDTSFHLRDADYDRCWWQSASHKKNERH